MIKFRVIYEVHMCFLCDSNNDGRDNDLYGSVPPYLLNPNDANELDTDDFFLPVGNGNIPQELAKEWREKGLCGKCGRKPEFSNLQLYCFNCNIPY